MLTLKKSQLLLLTFSSFFISGNLFAAPDYSNQELSHNDMTHQDLTGAIFDGSKIRHVDFSNSNLQGAIFRNATLSNLNFENANLTGTSFINSNLSHLKMNAIDIKHVKFINSKLMHVKMNNTNLTNVEFSDSELKHVQMKEACLTNAQFIKNKITLVKLDKSILTGAKFFSNQSKQFSKKNAIYNGDKECVQVVAALSGNVFSNSSSLVSTRTNIANSNEITTALNDKNSGKIDLTINFDYDSDLIKSEAHDQIYEISQALQSSKLNNVKIEIEGHTDSDGSNDYNLDLSHRRAISVKKELVESYNIPASRFSVEGYGESQPIASNNDDMGKALNRRVTLVNLNISPKSVSFNSKSIKHKINVTDTNVNIGDYLTVETKANGSSKSNTNVNIGDFLKVETKSDGTSRVRLGDFISVN